MPIERLPRLYRLLSPDDFQISVSDRRSYQLSETAPKEGEPGYPWPHFGVTENAIVSKDDAELFSYYVSSDTPKFLRFKLIAGESNIYCRGAGSNILWSINDTMVWTGNNIIFNPTLQNGQISAGEWPGADPAKTDLIGDAENPEEILFNIYLSESIIENLSQGDNKILISVEDFNGNKIIVPVTITKIDATIGVGASPDDTIIFDLSSGRHYTRGLGNTDMDIIIETNE